jgi:hypothetical protein
MTRRHASLLQRLTPQSPEPLLDHPLPHSPTSLFPARDRRQAPVVGHSPPSPGHSPPRAAPQSASAAPLDQSGRHGIGNASVHSNSSVTDMVRSWAVGSKDADKLLEWAKLYEQRRASPSDLAASGDMQAHHVPSLFPPGTHSLFPRQLPPGRGAGSGSPPEREAGKAHPTSGWAIVKPDDGSSMSMSMSVSPPENTASTHRKLGLDSRVDTGEAESSPVFPRGPGQQRHEHHLQHQHQHQHQHQQEREQEQGATHTSSPRDTVLLKSQSGRVEASFELSPRYLPLSSPTLSHGSEPQEPGDLAPIDQLALYEDNR